MLVNLLLLRGNMGKEGAGILPVRGHSNVQGQRTVGITEKAAKVPVDNLRRQFGFEPPSEDGVNTVEACEGILDGKYPRLHRPGRQLVRAIPDTPQMEPAWRKLRLSVQVSTKLNRNHPITGEVSYILPCLGRTEIDRQATGEQRHTTEDSTGCIRWRGAASRLANCSIGTGDHRATGRCHARAQPDAGLGRLGRGLQPDPATPSPRATRRSSTTSRA